MSTNFIEKDIVQYTTNLDKTQFLFNVCTHPDTRGEGLCKSLLIAVINSYSRDFNIFILTVHSHDLIPYSMYTQLGFKKVGVLVGDYILCLTI